MVVIIYCYIGCKDEATTWYSNGFLKKNQNAPRPPEHPLVLLFLTFSVLGADPKKILYLHGGQFRSSWSAEQGK